MTTGLSYAGDNGGRCNVDWRSTLTIGHVFPAWLGAEDQVALTAGQSRSATISVAESGLYRITNDDLLTAEQDVGVQLQGTASAPSIDRKNIFESTVFTVDCLIPWKLYLRLLLHDTVPEYLCGSTRYRPLANR